MSRLKVISLSVESEMHELLKTSAKISGRSSVSALVRDLVNKYLGLIVNDGEETPVILKIPNDLNEEQLKNWLRVKSEAIVQAFRNTDTNV